MATLVTEDVEDYLHSFLREGFNSVLNIITIKVAIYYNQGMIRYNFYQELMDLLADDSDKREALLDELIRIFHIVSSFRISSESVIMTREEREREARTPKRHLADSIPTITNRYSTAATSKVVFRTAQGQVLMDSYDIDDPAYKSVVLREFFELLKSYSLLLDGAKYNKQLRQMVSPELDTISKFLHRYHNMPTAPSNDGQTRWHDGGMYHGVNTITYIKIDYTKGVTVRERKEL